MKILTLKENAVYRVVIQYAGIKCQLFIPYECKRTNYFVIPKSTSSLRGGDIYRRPSNQLVDDAHAHSITIIV